MRRSGRDVVKYGKVSVYELWIEAEMQQQSVRGGGAGGMGAAREAGSVAVQVRWKRSKHIHSHCKVDSEPASKVAEPVEIPLTY